MMSRKVRLRVKKVKKYQNVLEGSINKNYRFLFQITSKGYLVTILVLFIMVTKSYDPGGNCM